MINIMWFNIVLGTLNIICAIINRDYISIVNVALAIWCLNDAWKIHLDIKRENGYQEFMNGYYDRNAELNKETEQPYTK